MLKKTIKYPDLDGNEIVEDFYFNLSKAEIAEMELMHEGGFGAYLHRIVESQDGAAIISTFKEIIGSAIGRRSEDGRRFIKSEEITQDFMQTEAYSQLFMELVTDAEAAATFVRGIVPTDVRDAVTEGRPIEDLPMPAESDGGENFPTETPAYMQEMREPTQAELQAMSKEELTAAFQWRENLKRSK